MSPDSTLQRVLIASGHPLFGEGLRSLLQNYWGESLEIVGLTSELAETIHALTNLKPDLIIVDHDDVHLNRDEFLHEFIQSTAEIRIVLLSLKERSEVEVYDRRTMTASKIEDWLKTGIPTDRAIRGED